MEARQVMLVLWVAEQMRGFVEKVDACVDALDEEQREIYEILTDGCGEEITRICDILDVTKSTAYRRKEAVLERLDELFRAFHVQLGWDDIPRIP